MRHKSNIFLLFGMLTCLLLAACSSPTVEDPGAAFKNQSESKIFHEGQKKLKDGDYIGALKRFNALDVLYPFGQYAQQAQLDTVYAYYKNGDVPSTLAAADRYIHLYPLGKGTDYAYYVRGLAEFYENTNFVDRHLPTDFAQRDVSSLKKAFLDFNELMTRFPDSPYVADAHQRMIYIRNMIAKRILEIAHFYYVRNAYVGAANRANEVIQHYQGTPSVPGALVILVESYTALGDKTNAEQALHVLELNYPNAHHLPQLTKDVNALS